jgi:Deltex C-terminal domain
LAGLNVAKVRDTNGKTIKNSLLSTMASVTTASTASIMDALPVENSDLRRHRIHFYAKYGISLDSTSARTFNEQVTENENRIASDKRKVMTVEKYMSYVSSLQANKVIPGFSLTSDNAYKLPNETFALMKETKDGKFRVAHSCNVFTLMVHFHYQNQGSHHKWSNNSLLREKLYVSVENANAFVSTGPLSPQTMALPSASVSEGTISSAVNVQGLCAPGCAQLSLPTLKAAPAATQVGGGKPAAQSIDVATSAGPAQPALLSASTSSTAQISGRLQQLPPIYPRHSCRQPVKATLQLRHPLRDLVPAQVDHSRGGKTSAHTVKVATSTVPAQPSRLTPTAPAASGSTKDTASSTSSTAQAPVSVAINHAMQDGGGKPSTQSVKVRAHQSQAAPVGKTTRSTASTAQAYIPLASNNTTQGKPLTQSAKVPSSTGYAQPLQTAPAAFVATNGAAGLTALTAHNVVPVTVVSNRATQGGGGKPSTQSAKVASSTGYAQPSQTAFVATKGATGLTASTVQASVLGPVGSILDGGRKPLTQSVNVASSIGYAQPSQTAIGTKNGAAVSTASTVRASIPISVVSNVTTQHGGGKPSTQLATVASSAAHAQPSNTASVANGANGATAATYFTAQSSAPIPPSNSTVQPAKRKAGELDSDASARAFVDCIQTMIDQVKGSSKCDVVLVLEKKLVERALIAQEEFHGEGKPFNIDIGYHYTGKENLASIQEEGLLSKNERSSKGIVAKFNGASYGNGIYTCSNPWYHHGLYGDTGLMVARLVGTNCNHGTSTRSDSVTVVRDQVPITIVLSEAKQCFPILRFDAHQIVQNNKAHPGNVSLAAIHVEVQHIIDDILQPRKVKAKLSATQHFASTQAPPAAPEQVLYVAPETLGVSGQRDASMAYGQAATMVFCALAVGMVSHLLAVRMASRKLVGGMLILDIVGTCIIVGAIRLWGTATDWGRSRKKTVRTPQGDMPSGEMTIGQSVKPCDGYIGYPTIMIKYDIPAGVQRLYHPKPGVGYQGTCRHAYVPDTAEGRLLLNRLKFAFQHGLTFSVGDSLALLKDNSVIWASIPHKTSMGGGVLQYGFPDPGYIDDCNSELDKLGVPKAEFL